jgi:hypothetical protein
MTLFDIFGPVVHQVVDVLVEGVCHCAGIRDDKVQVRTWRPSLIFHRILFLSRKCANGPGIHTPIDAFSYFSEEVEGKSRAFIMHDNRIILEECGGWRVKSWCFKRHDAYIYIVSACLDWNRCT